MLSLTLYAKPAHHGSTADQHERSLSKRYHWVPSRTEIMALSFQTDKGEQSLQISPSRTSNDGAVIHRWAKEGYGIALKSIWDVIEDIRTNKLVTLFDDYKPNYQSKDTSRGMDLHVAYPSREYLPQRTRCFIDALTTYFSEKTSQYSL